MMPLLISDGAPAGSSQIKPLLLLLLLLLLLCSEGGVGRGGGAGWVAVGGARCSGWEVAGVREVWAWMREGKGSTASPSILQAGVARWVHDEQAECASKGAGR